MENNQPTNPFDAMLKQSLEGTQMPVPTGVWETVGSAIIGKTVVSSAVVSLKLTIIKTLAGIILTGAVTYGVYEFLTPQIPVKVEKTTTINTPKIDSKNNTIQTSSIEEKSTLLKQKVIQTPSDFTICKPIYTAIDSIRDIINSVEEKKNDKIGEVDNTQSEINSIAHKNELPIANKIDEKTDKESTLLKIESQSSNQPIFTEPSNVFTPDGDGLNDYFKIEVENEKSFILQIVDEKGKLVFETTDKNKYWDGKNIFTGLPCKKGFYYYKLIIEFNNGFKKKCTSGISLL